MFGCVYCMTQPLGKGGHTDRQNMEFFTQNQLNLSNTATFPSEVWLHTRASISSRFMVICYRQDTNKLWADIQRLAVKTCIAVAPELKVEYRAEVPPGKPGPNPFQVWTKSRCSWNFNTPMKKVAFIGV